MSDELKSAQLFDTKPFSMPRVPQRFVFDDDGRTRYGICWPYPDGSWRLDTMQGFALFDADPWEVLGHVIGPKADSVAWLDNDFGWQGKSFDQFNAERSPKTRWRRPRFDQLIEAIADQLYAKLPVDVEICLRFSSVDDPILELIELKDEEGHVIANGLADAKELRRLIDLAIYIQDEDDEDEDDDE